MKQSDLKAWAAERWVLSGHLASASKMIEYHHDNTPLSPIEEHNLDLILDLILEMQKRWEGSQHITRKEAILGFSKKRPYLKCKPRRHKYALYKTGTKIGRIFEIRRCQACHKTYTTYI